MNIPEKPIPESYWVLPDRFLAGGYPTSTYGIEVFSRQRLSAFLNAGFNAFFDLTRPDELPAYETLLQEEAEHYSIQVDYRRLAILDRGLPTPEQMKANLILIDLALAAGRKVYVHCWGGIGRTGTTVGCWLVHHGLTGEAALARLNEIYQTSSQSTIYSHSPETDAQIAFILSWEG